VVAWLGVAAWLPAQVAVDTCRVVRGGGHDRWDRVPVRDEAARRAVATLLLSASPGTYVAAVEPGALAVHRLGGRPSRLEHHAGGTGLLEPPGPQRGTR
jgi:hypothetical protein